MVVKINSHYKTELLNQYYYVLRISELSNCSRWSFFAYYTSQQPLSLLILYQFLLIPTVYL